MEKEYENTVYFALCSIDPNGVRAPLGLHSRLTDPSKKLVSVSPVRLYQQAA